jgi:hypothetical protein
LADPEGASCLKTDSTGADDGVQQASRNELAQALGPGYVRAGTREKSQLLDEFCALSGCTRTPNSTSASCWVIHPVKIDHGGSAAGRAATRRPSWPFYVCWSATDGICSKRLAPFLPELLEDAPWRSDHAPLRRDSA